MSFGHAGTGRRRGLPGGGRARLPPPDRRVTVHDAGVLRGIEPAEFTRRVEGCRFGAPTRRSKWLIVTLTPGSTRWLFHFGMTGSLHWCDTDTAAHRHDRVEFRTRGGVLIPVESMRT